VLETFPPDQSPAPAPDAAHATRGALRDSGSSLLVKGRSSEETKPEVEVPPAAPASLPSLHSLCICYPRDHEPDELPEPTRVSAQYSVRVAKSFSACDASRHPFSRGTHGPDPSDPYFAIRSPSAYLILNELEGVPSKIVVGRVREGVGAVEVERGHNLKRGLDWRQEKTRGAVWPPSSEL
jgi:hypothetical protein